MMTKFLSMDDTRRATPSTKSHHPPLVGLSTAPKSSRRGADRSSLLVRMHPKRKVYGGARAALNYGFTPQLGGADVVFTAFRSPSRSRLPETETAAKQPLETRQTAPA